MWFWLDGPMGGARICRGGSVLLGGMVVAIETVVAVVGNCGCCVCFFFLVPLVCGRCSGFWCGCLWFSMVFFFGRCLEVEGKREEKEERDK